METKKINEKRVITELKEVLEDIKYLRSINFPISGNQKQVIVIINQILKTKCLSKGDAFVLLSNLKSSISKPPQDYQNEIMHKAIVEQSYVCDYLEALFNIRYIRL